MVAIGNAAEPRVGLYELDPTAPRLATVRSAPALLKSRASPLAAVSATVPGEVFTIRPVRVDWIGLKPKATAAPAPTVTSRTEPPMAAAELNRSTPALTVVPPVYPLVPERITVPVPIFSNTTAPMSSWIAPGKLLLLLESPAPGKEIAGQSGFGNYHHLCRAFQRREGMSPIEFRKLRLASLSARDFGDRSPNRNRAAQPATPTQSLI